MLSRGLVGLLMALCLSAQASSVLLDHSDVLIDEIDLAFYLKERLRPEVYESALAKPDAIKNAIVNLYVVRKAAQIAIAEGLVSQREVAFRRTDGADRVGLQAFVSDRVGDALAATDWKALADEKYIAQQDVLGPREQVKVQQILIKSEGRSFTELVAIVDKVRERIDGGEAFDALAAELSEDPSAERNQGNIGFINPGQTHPEFERVAYALTEPGQVSDPVLTPYGVHFIKFVERRSVGAISQDVVQRRLIKGLKKERESALRGEVLAPFRGEAWPLVENLDEAAIAQSVLKQLDS